MVGQPAGAHVEGPAADFHVHASHSNLQGPEGQALADEARARGLDVVPVTEYVTSQHWRELGPVQDANPDLVIWPGREIVTYFGHANALGETPSVLEFRHGFEGARLRDVQRAARADGALFQVNHPTTFPGPAFTSFCRGCEFTLGNDIDWDGVDTMEVLTGPVLVDPSLLGLPALPPLIENPFMRPAIALWERQLNAGHRITGVSGSDSKGVEPAGQRYGTSVTAIYSPALSRPAVVAALRKGHAYVRTRGVDASPEVEVTADGTRRAAGVDTADLLSLTTIGGPIFLAGPEPARNPDAPGGGADPATAGTTEILPRTGDSRDHLAPGLALALAAAIVSATRRRTR